MSFKKEIRWFITQMRPLFRGQFLSVFFTVLSSAMYLLDPLIIKWMIDVVFPKKDLRLLLLGGVGIFAIYVCRLSFSSIGSLINFSTVQKLSFRMRLNLLKHALPVGVSADYGRAPSILQSGGDDLGR